MGQLIGITIMTKLDRSLLVMRWPSLHYINDDGLEWLLGGGKICDAYLDLPNQIVEVYIDFGDEVWIFPMLMKHD